MQISSAIMEIIMEVHQKIQKFLTQLYHSWADTQKAPYTTRKIPMFTANVHGSRHVASLDVHQQKKMITKCDI